MKKLYSILNIAALIIGVLLGIFVPEFSEEIAFLGTWYINILKVLVGPIIFVSIAVSMVNSKKGDSKLIFKTVGLFIIMFISTFLITSLIVGLIQPGANFTLEEGSSPGSTADFSLLSILKSLLPSSLKSFLMGGSIFFVILLAFIISLIFILIKPVKEPYAKVMSFIKKILNYVLKVVFILTPIAVISLVSNLVIKLGTIALSMGLTYIILAYVCSIVAVILVMILPVWIICKINPITYIRKVAKIWLITLSTRSSVATLPHTIRVCNEDFNVDEKITNIVVPLGCTIHMCGGAVSFSLLGLFVAQMSNVTVTIPMYLLMLLSATLINMAAPGIPGGGVVIGFTYLQLLGLPVNTFFGFYSGAYTILDMTYTTLNVTGDISANILINHSESKKVPKI